MKIFSKKSSDTSFCILCLLISLSFFILLFFGSHEDFSERENRALQKLPKISLGTITNGSFFSKISDFSSDQFPARSFFCSLSSLSDLALMREECNGIIVAEEGYLIAHPEYENSEIFSENLNAISSFFKSNENIKSFLLVAPRSIDVMTDRLPYFLSEHYGKNEYEFLEKTIKNENLINCKDNLKHLSSNKQTWYKTDHHWTTRSAYEAYLLICQQLGLTAYPLEYFNIETITDTFLGTSFSKSGLPLISSLSDSIEIYRYDGDENFEITSLSTKKATYGFYDMSALEKKDKYQIFLGGNFDILQIRDTEKEKPKMLLVKDSFANCLIPFLALHYDIDVIDLRYYKASLGELTHNSRFDNILLVYGIDTLYSEASCANIIK